jgi:phosphoribosylanthranilate isomerase
MRPSLSRVTRVKFCGITRPEDAELAAELEAWAIGMIFWPGTERRCDPGVAAGIAQDLRRRVETVGVFVNPTLDHVAAMVDGIGLTAVQLHGDEGPAYCAEVARRTGAKVIKAHGVRSRADVQVMRTFHTDFHLLDTGRPGRRGGTGETWDWALAQGGVDGVPFLLSGGLTPDNVADGIAEAAPWGVDVASGVEISPGVKDPEKMHAFAAAVAATAPAPPDAPPPEDAPAPDDAPAPA